MIHKQLFGKIQKNLLVRKNVLENTQYHGNARHCGAPGLKFKVRNKKESDSQQNFYPFSHSEIFWKRDGAQTSYSNGLFKE